MSVLTLTIRTLRSIPDRNSGSLARAANCGPIRDKLNFTLHLRYGRIQERTALETPRPKATAEIVEGQEGSEELTALTRRQAAGAKPLDALRFICDNGMESVP